MFSILSVFTILALGIGTVVIVLGMMYGYRPAAVIGLMILAGISAAALHLETILAANVLMTAVLGRLIPLLVIAVLSLMADEPDLRVTIPTIRPFTIALILGSGCLFAAPVFGLILGLINPAFTTSLNLMNEIGIMMLISVIGAIVVTRGGSES